MKKIPLSFYNRKDVLLIARELLGKIIVTCFEGETTSGRIVETEAYIGLVDRASHSYRGRRTARNEHMYATAGTVYVYICYGLHQMCNIVTNEKGIPDAVLIRAVEPVEGLDIMLKRAGKVTADRTITRGPGKVAAALGVHRLHSGKKLSGKEIFLVDDLFVPDDRQVGVSKRIGVEGAGEAAHLPYRFFIKGNPYVSGKNK